MRYRDRPELHALLFVVVVCATSFVAVPAMAGSQSSNSSSNCSNGRCSRVDTLVIEDRYGRVRGWQRVEAWQERRSRTIRLRRLGRDD